MILIIRHNPYESCIVLDLSITILLQLVTVYQHVACLAAIPASYAGHRLMVETIQVILIAD